MVGAAVGAVVAVARTAGGRAGEHGAGARLLRLLLRQLGVPDDRWELRREPHGRPVLWMRRASAGASAPGCSISHSAGLVAVCVAAGGAVGIDVQELPGPDHRWLRVASRWLHPDESAALARRAAVDPAGARAAFTTVWAVREARCKATGQGLAGLASPDPVYPDPASGGDEVPGLARGGRLGGVWWRTLPAPKGFAAALARADRGGEALLRRPVAVWTLDDQDPQGPHWAERKPLPSCSKCCASGVVGTAPTAQRFPLVVTL